MRTSSERFRKVAELARRQHGLFTRRQALELDMTSNQLKYGVRNHRFERVAPQLYRIAGFGTTWEQRLLGTILTGPEGTLASHRSAAHLWGLEGCRRGHVEVSLPRHHLPERLHQARYHESTDLDLAAPTTRNGIPVTGLVRTLIDLAAVVPYERLDQAVDHAIRNDMTSWQAIAKIRARHSRRGRNGVGKMRELLEVRYGTTIPDSYFGRLVADLLVDGALPTPKIEHNIYSSKGEWLARADLAYPEHRIVIELDSREFHTDKESFERDRERQNRLELEGWLVLRFTWKFYSRHPRKLCNQVAAALRLRSS